MRDGGAIVKPGASISRAASCGKVQNPIRDLESVAFASSAIPVYAER